MQTPVKPQGIRPIVLFTRPQRASEDVAQALAARVGPLRAVISPSIEIRALDVSDKIDSRAILVFSSVHAVAALQRSGKANGQTAYCVGDATQKAAQQAGLNAISASGDATDLVRLILDTMAPGPLIWLRGSHVTASLGNDLRDAGFSLTETVVYEQIGQALTPDAERVLAGQEPVIIPIYSPRSGRLISAQMAQTTAPLHVVFISAAAAEAWAGPTPAHSYISTAPDGSSMLDALSCCVAAAWPA